MSERLREFWLCDNTDNSGWSVDTEYSHKNHFGSVNVFHVIEKSAYDALAERLAECEAVLSDYVVNKGLSHKAQSYYAKYDGDEYFNKRRNK